MAITKNGEAVFFERDVTVTNSNLFIYELTIETIAEISTELFRNGIDVVSISIDEARINYIEIEVL